MATDREVEIVNNTPYDLRVTVSADGKRVVIDPGPQALEETA